VTALRRALLILSLVTVPATAHAQVFLAEAPHPQFAIGPLFVRATVEPGSAPATVEVLWALTFPSPAARLNPGDALYILWPAAITGEGDASPADSALVNDLQARGFIVVTAGRLPLSARDRSKLGTGDRQEVPLEPASFVVFSRERRRGGQAPAATFIKMPWSDRFGDPLSVMRLRFHAPGMVGAKSATWAEETFWGRRYVASMSFGDVAHMSLYPMYFQHRDRVVRLAPDFSQLVVNFTHADHLRIEEVFPQTATRRPSETRDAVESVSMPLASSEGIAPQVLRVQFSYFGGRIAWRPILISVLLLGLGNATGPLVVALFRRLARRLRARLHVGRDPSSGPSRHRGVIVPREVAERIRPGETRYEDVIALCGRDAEEQERLPSRHNRTLVYRGHRVLPHRTRGFGWLAAVSHWDVEHHELQIDFEGDLVVDVQARIRRSRLAEPQAG